MSVSDEHRATYTRLIDNVLRGSDLEQVSAKQIRKGVQAQVDHDISPFKEAINALIIERFDHFRELESSTPSAAAKPEPVVKQSKPAHVNGSSNGLPKPATPRPAKRPSPNDDDDAEAPSEKATKAHEEDDAAYAARLQAEFNNADRPTRGAGGRKQRSTAPVKRTPKKKSAARVKSDDDSDVASDSDVADKPKRNGAFHKLMALSEPLQRLTGEPQLSRPQTVKKIWDYVKQHDLQNPEDKRQILCDDMLRAIFKQDSVHMFTMNKILSKNLYPIDE